MKISDTTELNSLIEQIKAKQLETGADFNEFLQSNMKFDEVVKAIKSTSQGGDVDGVSDVVSLLGDTLAKSMNMVAGFGDTNEQTDSENSFLSADMQRKIKEDAQMFKTFDFMQIMNQLIYGNKTESEKQDLLNQAIKISKEV